MQRSQRSYIQNETEEVFFTKLFTEHEYKLHTLIYRITKSHTYSQDIMQEVFLKLWENRAAFSGVQNWEAYLYRVTENKLLDFLRKAAHNKKMQRAIFENMNNTASPADEKTIINQYHSIIQTAIEQLPAQRRAIYELSRKQGFDNKEIAEHLHLSPQTVKNQLSSALKSLRKILGNSFRIFF